MAETITAVTIATDTFEQLVTQVNLAINCISNRVVTANGDANGASTTGNTFIYGIAGANTLVAWNSIRGGNVQVSNTLWLSSNLAMNTNVFWLGNSTVNAVVNSISFTLANSTVTFTIPKPTAAQVSDGNYFLNANGSYTLAGGDDSTTTTTGISAQLIDSYLVATYRAAEYVVTVKDNNNNGHQISKLLTIWDGSDGLVSEYGVVQSNGNQGTFTANANSTAVRVYITPGSTNATIRLIKTQLAL